MSSPVQIASLLPENAPFTPEQRTWLNGLFAGLLGLDGTATALSPEQAALLLPGVALPAAPAAEADDDAPWHDPAMALGERMQLAEGRPLPRRLMAAMAQQDCGQCGYNCRDYANALFGKTEARLNLCVPGGKETARMLRTLHAEFEATPTPAPAAPIPAAPVPAPPGIEAVRCPCPDRRAITRSKRSFWRAGG